MPRIMISSKFIFIIILMIFFYFLFFAKNYMDISYSKLS